MSDDLDRAVDARIDAYRPDRVPPFEAIKARRARRARTRAAGAAALSVAVVAGLAFGASTIGGGPDRLPTTYAGPQDLTQATYVLRYDTLQPLGPPTDDAAVRECTALPGVSGVSAEETLPPVYVVTFDGTAAQAEAFTDCADALPGISVTSQEQDPADTGRLAGADAYLGVWTGPDGTPAERGQGRDRTYELTSRRMPDHCGWEKAVVLQIPWPVGSTSVIGPDSVPVREYMRDPDGVLPEVRGAFRSGLDLDAALPQGAQPTGYRLDDVELWFGPDNGAEHVYLVRPDGVERWPRAFEDILCA